MIENNNKKVPAVRLLWPEFSMTLPGDAAVGIILTLQTKPAGNFTPAGLAVAILTGIVLIAAVFCLRKTNTAHSPLTGYATGMYRLAIICFCSAVISKTGILWQAAAAGAGLAIYSAAAIRPGIERFIIPAKKLGFAAWWPSVLTGVFGMLCVARNFSVYDLTAPTWASIYVGAWLLFRTAYVSNAIKGWCSSERLFQASGLFIRGTIPVQAILFMFFYAGNPWHIVAAAFLAMGMSAVQTLACKILPTPDN